MLTVPVGSNKSTSNQLSDHCACSHQHPMNLDPDSQLPLTSTLGTVSALFALWTPTWPLPYRILNYASLCSDLPQVLSHKPAQTPDRSFPSPGFIKTLFCILCHQIIGTNILICKLKFSLIIWDEMCVSIEIWVPRHHCGFGWASFSLSVSLPPSLSSCHERSGKLNRNSVKHTAAWIEKSVQ